MKVIPFNSREPSVSDQTPASYDTGGNPGPIGEPSPMLPLSMHIEYYDNGILTTVTDEDGVQSWEFLEVATGGVDTNVAITDLTANATHSHDFATFSQAWNNLGSIVWHTDTQGKIDAENV